jgi:transcriptional antiterminator RfaH
MPAVPPMNRESTLTEDPAWYVVGTKRHNERLAHAQLGQRCIASYLPMIAEWPRPAVGSDVQPLFPGYLFVRAVLPRDFYKIAWCHGIRSFITVAGIPGSVDDGAIEFLRSQEGPDGLVHWRPALSEKTVVRIVEGPFSGLSGMLEQRLPARHRVRVLLHLLQRETPVELPERWVQRA